MNGRLRLEVVTPRRKVLDREADEIRLPGALGELGILPGHTPLLTNLEIGPLTIIDQGQTSLLAVFGGFAEVLPDRVTVLVSGAEQPDEIDIADARKTKSEAEEAMKSADSEGLPEITSDAEVIIAQFGCISLKCFFQQRYCLVVLVRALVGNTKESHTVECFGMVIAKGGFLLL